MSVGIDIVDMRRISNIERLAKRVLSNEEYSIYQSRIDNKEFLAGRFAAKEAFLKAKHLGIGFIPFSSISIIYERDGAPVLVHEGKRYDVSISHDGNYAIAIVII